MHQTRKRYKRAISRRKYGSNWRKYLVGVGNPLWRGVRHTGRATRESSLAALQAALGTGQMLMGMGGVALSPITGISLPFGLYNISKGGMTYGRVLRRMPNIVYDATKGLTNMGMAGYNLISPVIPYIT